MPEDRSTPIPLKVSHPGFTGRIGFARCDMTPPVGIYSRMWGSAEHDEAAGIHRPLMATAAAFFSHEGNQPLVLISLDWGWWRRPDDECFIREAILETLSLSASQLMIALSHTHAGPSSSLHVADKPGGDLVAPYMHEVRDKLIALAREAVESAVPGELAWTTGRCDLAGYRDQPDPDGDGLVVGYYPNHPADDTVLVGRATNTGREPIGTIVNYACHLTTLGGKNKLVSPDYIGAMREVVEAETDDAPCLFLQGASGDLAPKLQYQADAEVADRHGRQLGYAVLSAMDGMSPPGKAMAYAGTEESGTRLGRWDLVEHEQDPRLEALTAEVALPLKPELAPADLQKRLDDCEDRVIRERLERLATLTAGLSGGEATKLRIYAWRIGGGFMIATPAEACSIMQQQLRAAFPDAAIAVGNIVNGYASYLPTAANYDQRTYTSQVALFARGCLETTINACRRVLEQLGAGKDRT
jgi:hypothetical protein